MAVSIDLCSSPSGYEPDAQPLFGEDLYGVVRSKTSDADIRNTRASHGNLRAYIIPILAIRLSGIQIISRVWNQFGIRGPGGIPAYLRNVRKIFRLILRLGAQQLRPQTLATLASPRAKVLPFLEIEIQVTMQSFERKV